MGRPLVVVLALVAALCAALGIVIRQRATQEVPAEQAMSTAIVATLSRNPLWWAGTLTAVAGYVCQALALSKGSLLLVQPLLVTSLLFALPISAALSHRRIARSEWGWALLLTLGLAVFVVVGQPREGHYRPPVPAWALVVTMFVPLVVVCVALAARAAGRRRAVLLAVAVAVLFATVAVLTKISMHRLTVGGLKALLIIPAPYLVLVLAVGATVLQQSAFHAGELQTSVPTMLVLEPLVAVLLGVVVLGEHLAVTGAAAGVLPVAVVAMVAPTIALARGSAAHDEQLAVSAAAPEPAASNPARSG
jgi:drug/metabolite transporter (DMT)-like permease